MRLKNVMAAIAAAIVGGLAFASNAETITASVDSTQIGLATVTFNLSSHTPSSDTGLAGLIYWHRTDSQNPGVVYSNDVDNGGIGNDFQTYCIELYQNVNLGAGPYTYRVVPLNMAPNPGDPVGNLSDAKVKALQVLWSLDHPVTGAPAATHAAFQLAIWEIVFDDFGTPPTLDLTTGDFTVTSVASGIYATAQSYLSDVAAHPWDLNASYPGLLALTSDTAQDQVLAISFAAGNPDLPVPAAAGMVPVLLGLWAGTRRLRSHSAK